MLLLMLAIDAGAADLSPTISGLITDQRLTEASGVSAARLSADVYWLVNDSGNDAELIAVSATGSLLSQVRVIGATNHDWEDLAGFDHGSGPQLVIADTGDNEGKRNLVRLYIVDEPPSDGSVTEVPVQRRLDFSYPDAPHDVEALAIDPLRPYAYVVTKRTSPPVMYSVDLRAPGPQVARAVSTLSRLPSPSAEERRIDPRYARYMHQPTAMDISCDGLELWILTYSSIQRFQRRPEERWRQATSRRDPQGLGLPIPLLPQAEALAFSRDCSSVLVFSEKTPGPIVRYPLRASSQQGGPSESSVLTAPAPLPGPTTPDQNQSSDPLALPSAPGADRQ